MVAKIPVLCTDLPAVKSELIEDMHSGIFLSDKDSKGVADKIELVYRNEDLRQKIAENGFKKVQERFDIRKNVKELVEVFNNYIEI